jgi:hypothetical protein
MRRFQLSDRLLGCGVVFLLVSLVVGPAGIQLGSPLCAEEKLFEVNLEKIQNDLDRYLQQADGFLNENKIRETRQKVTFVEQKLDAYKKELPRQDRDRYKARINTLQGDIETRIDSLVKVNISLIRHQGATAAIEFRRTLAMQYGIPEAELAEVDEAIVNSGAYDEETRAQEVAAPVRSIEQTTPDLSYDERSRQIAREREERERQAQQAQEQALQARAEKERAENQRVEQARTEKERLRAREQAHQDSVMAEQAEQRRVEQEYAQRERIRLEQAAQERAKTQMAQSDAEREREQRDRQDSLRAVEQRLRQIDRERSRAEKAQTDDLRERQAWAHRDSMQAVEDQARRSREQARSEQVAAQKAVLERLDRSDDETSEADSLLRARSEELQRREERDAGVAKAQETSRKIEQLVASGNVEEANTVFGIYEPSMRRYLELGAYEKIRNAVTSRYADYQHKLLTTSQQFDMIRSLVERKKGAEAHSLFRANRVDLAAFTDRETFTALQRDIEASYNDFLQQRKKALAATQRIREQLAAKKTEHAYALFQESNDLLNGYLDKDELATLQTAVTNAYSTMLDKKRWAELYERDIRGLINDERGAEALSRFDQGRTELHQYLSPATYESLRVAVTKAYAQYTQRQANARQIADMIHTLLSQKKTEKANDRFKQYKETLRSYLNDPAAYDELQSSVAAAYADLQQKKRWANQISRSVSVLLEQKEGAEAYSRFMPLKDSLSNYLPATTIDSLGLAVTRGRDEYARNHTAAQDKATQIGNLLTQKRSEEAYNAFQQAKNHLDHYLDDDKAYNALANQVSAAYRELMELRQQAASRMREIQKLIDQREGVKALELYQTSLTQITKYADSIAVRQLGTAAAKAAADYKTNQAKAYAQVAEIRKLIEQDKVDKAYLSFRGGRSTLRHYIEDAAAFESLTTAVTQAYKALLEKRSQAVKQQREITALIRRQEGRQAQARFERDQAFLAQYLDGESFKLLAANTQRANAEYLEAQAEAERIAARIAVHLTNKKIKEAYALLDENHNDLEKHLERAVFASMEKSVESQYEALQEKERLALQQVREINAFIKQLRGDRAAGRFEQRKLDLQKYLDQPTFVSLQQRVTAAKIDYDKNRHHALDLTARIKKDLAGEKTEQAYLVFRAEQPALRNYLDEKEYAALDAAVSRPYAVLMERRKAAKEQLGEIAGMLKSNKVAQANRVYYKIQPKLKKYLPAEEYEQLDTNLIRLTGQFVLQENAAEQATSHIYTLIRGERIDSAFVAFKKSRGVLRQYLDQKAYARLERTVVASVAKIERERKMVRDYERKISRLIDQGSFLAAYRSFHATRWLLKKHLDPAVFKKMEKRIVTEVERRRGKRT